MVRLNRSIQGPGGGLPQQEHHFHAWRGGTPLLQSIWVALLPPYYQQCVLSSLRSGLACYERVLDAWRQDPLQQGQLDRYRPLRGQRLPPLPQGCAPPFRLAGGVDRPALGAWPVAAVSGAAAAAAGAAVLEGGREPCRLAVGAATGTSLITSPV